MCSQKQERCAYVPRQVVSKMLSEAVKLTVQEETDRCEEKNKTTKNGKRVSIGMRPLLSKPGNKIDQITTWEPLQLLKLRQNELKTIDKVETSASQNCRRKAEGHWSLTGRPRKYQPGGGGGG